jgi:protein TonB
MSTTKALYSAYGNYELKSKYQRNFGFGTGIVALFILAVLGVFALMSALQSEPDVPFAPVVVKTVADLGPPPSVARKPPQIAVDAPRTVAPKVGIPKPVADDEVIDEDVVLATREELAEIIAPDIASGTEAGDIVVDIAEEDYLPSVDEFVPVEIYPEMINQVQPEYPRFAKSAGIEGVVWVQALVDKDGSVVKAQVGKSSGTAALDEAAVEAAHHNTFKPGIQNGRPVACWVTYKVEFKLTSGG